MEHLVHCCENYFSPEIPPLNIIWFITKNCNYKCSYCCATGITKSINNSNLNFDLFQKSIKNIKTFITTPIIIQISGGEPTLHPDLLKMLSVLEKQDNIIEIVLFTNISCSISYLKEVFQHLNSKKIIFRISIHLEYHTSSNQMKNTLDKIKYLNSLGYVTRVSILSHPKLISTNKNLTELFKKELSSSLDNIYNTPLTFRTMKEDYTKNYKEIIKFNRNEYIILNRKKEIIKKSLENQDLEKVNWMGNYCFVNFFLFIDGIKIIDDPCRNIKNISNFYIIFEKTLQQFTKKIYKPIKCIYPFCNCMGLTQVPKINPIATKEQISKVLGWYK